jgi:hypothetical protein
MFRKYPLVSFRSGCRRRWGPLQQAFQALGRDVPAPETDARVFGPATAAVLKALQADLGLPDGAEPLTPRHQNIIIVPVSLLSNA